MKTVFTLILENEVSSNIKYLYIVNDINNNIFQKLQNNKIND